MCLSEKARRRLLISHQAASRNIASQLQWHSGDKDGLMEATAERVTSRETDYCYSKGHLHGSCHVSLEAGHHLEETQPTFTP